MSRWVWYLGWLIGWFVLLWSFLFVPVSNLFLDGGAISGAIRGLILVSGVGLLFFGFRYINRKLRTKDHDVPVRDNSLGAAESGMSDHEAAFIAAASEPTLGTATNTQNSSAGSHAVTSQRTDSDVERHAIHHGPVVGAVMKSAGNLLVRRAFAQAMKEVETKTYDAGLWAMALVECNGDERAARLAYMKARAVDLASANAKAAESAQQSSRTTRGT